MPSGPRVKLRNTQHEQMSSAVPPKNGHWQKHTALTALGGTSISSASHKALHAGAVFVPSAIAPDGPLIDRLDALSARFGLS